MRTLRVEVSGQMQWRAIIWRDRQVTRSFSRGLHVGNTRSS